MRRKLLEQPQGLEGHKHTPLEFRSLGRLRMVPGIGRENRPSMGTFHSSYTCLTASGKWKREIKRIRKLTEACKPICPTWLRLMGMFAPNTARIESRPVGNI